MKSMLIVSHQDSGIGSGSSSPIGGCLRALVRVQRSHVFTYFPCTETFAATSSFGTLAQVSSTFPRVLLLACHGAGTQCVAEVRDHSEHTSFLKSVRGPLVRSTRPIIPSGHVPSSVQLPPWPLDPLDLKFGDVLGCPEVCPALLLQL